MNKNEKIIIGILVLILLVMIGILVMSKTNKQDTNVYISSNENDYTLNKTKELEKIVKVNGKLYYDTGEVDESSLRCGMMDGKITKVIAKRRDTNK